MAVFLSIQLHWNTATLFVSELSMAALHESYSLLFMMKTVWPTKA